MDQDILEELKNEAVDAAEDRIKSIEETLARFADGTLKSGDAMAAIRIDAHTVKSVAASFEIKPLHVIAHRFEDYFHSEKEMSQSLAKGLLQFTDRMSEVLDAWTHAREIDLASLMRRLPAKGGVSFDENSVTITDQEVMLVMEPGIANKIVTRELVECGYRMVNVASTMDAFMLIPSMRPDLVIISRVMPELSGVDLACALKAMPSTRDIPVALITSVESGTETVTDLPPGVPLLHKGSRFADDVADVFSELGLL